MGRRKDGLVSRNKSLLRKQSEGLVQVMEAGLRTAKYMFLLIHWTLILPLLWDSQSARPRYATDKVRQGAHKLAKAVALVGSGMILYNAILFLWEINSGGVKEDLALFHCAASFIAAPLSSCLLIKMKFGQLADIYNSGWRVIYNTVESISEPSIARKARYVLRLLRAAGVLVVLIIVVVPIASFLKPGWAPALIPVQPPLDSPAKLTKALLSATGLLMFVLITVIHVVALVLTLAPATLGLYISGSQIVRNGPVTSIARKYNVRPIRVFIYFHRIFAIFCQQLNDAYSELALTVQTATTTGLLVALLGSTICSEPLYVAVATFLFLVIFIILFITNHLFGHIHEVWRRAKDTWAYAAFDRRTRLQIMALPPIYVKCGSTFYYDKFILVTVLACVFENYIGLRLLF